MIELVLQSPETQRLFPTLLSTPHESCLVLLTQLGSRSRSLIRLLGCEFVVPPDSAYLRRSALEAQLSPEFVAHVAKRARNERCGLVFVHSHLDAESPTFSAIDDDGESHLAAFLQRRVPDATHLALLVNRRGVIARRLVRKSRFGSLRWERNDGFYPSTRKRATKRHRANWNPSIARFAHSEATASARYANCPLRSSA